MPPAGPFTQRQLLRDHTPVADGLVSSLYPMPRAGPGTTAPGHHSLSGVSLPEGAQGPRSPLFRVPVRLPSKDQVGFKACLRGRLTGHQPTRRSPWRKLQHEAMSFPFIITINSSQQ